MAATAGATTSCSSIPTRRENARSKADIWYRGAARAWQGRDYTSARLITKGKGDWTYGRIEVRAQLPRGRGSWPAIWMLGSTTPLRWPDDGEIDIMEHVGFDHGMVHASMHTAAYHHMQGTQRTAQTSSRMRSSGFHVYVTEWTADRIETSVDGRSYFAFAREPHAAGRLALRRVAAPAAERRGRRQLGRPQGVDDTTLPYRFLVDYVRVFQRAP